jgi:hypothetical protein
MCYFFVGISNIFKDQLSIFNFFVISNTYTTVQSKTFETFEYMSSRAKKNAVNKNENYQ